MKNISHIILALCLSSIASCKDTKKISVTVVEENGVPIEGADVHVAYIGYTPKDGPSIKGKSGKLGEFVANGNAPLRMKVMVDKKGYYSSVIKKLNKHKDHDLKIVLRRIKQPIPLYAKRLNRASPVLEKEYGYDFQKGDWVAPYGKGEIKDLLIKATTLRNNDRFFDYHIKKTFRFSNKDDGFLIYKKKQFSDFKSVYEAPLVGNYKDSWSYYIKRKPNEAVQTNADKSRCYVFRIRTKVDESGNIVSSHYAKAYGDFPDLKIYFNPTPNDRNLEFDPTKNLFKNLEPTENVREP